jgi:acyl-CoA thioester hydrolase
LSSWHESRLRVRFEETDTMGVVYYAKFFIFMEVGRVNLLRDIGLNPGDWRKRGFHIPVVQAHADYKASARFDDELLVKTRVTKVTNRSVRFDNEIVRLPDNALLCLGHTIHAHVDDSGMAVPFSDDARKKLTGD